MTHLCREVSSDKAYRFLQAVAKWSNVEYDDAIVIPENTEFSVISDLAEAILSKQDERASLAGHQDIYTGIEPDIYSNIYDADGNLTNLVCRSINNAYFWGGISFLSRYPSEKSRVVYIKCIDSIYVVKRLSEKTFEWASYFV
jgi:hypothetical protein